MIAMVHNFKGWMAAWRGRIINLFPGVMEPPSRDLALRVSFLIALLTIFTLSGWLLGGGRTPSPAQDLDASHPVLDVVYPRLEKGETSPLLPRLDSSFVFGSLKPAGGRVYVNGLPARLWDNGAFLAFIPLDTVSWSFMVLGVTAEGDSLTYRLPFSFTESSVSGARLSKPHPRNKLLPAHITIAQDHAALRCAPEGAYTIFPVRGAVALADSFAGSSYRVRLSADQHAWIEEALVTLDTIQHDPPRSAVGKISVRTADPWVKVDIPLNEPLLFHLEERMEVGKVVLDLYGATSRINRIDYDPQNGLIQEIRWSQLRTDVLRLEFFLRAPRLWGYGVTWEEGKYVLRLRQPPRFSRNVLKDRVIVLDPGHGGTQPGAVGPTRLAEKEPNLKLAQEMRTLLEKQGAKVYLTRETDSTVDLYQRVEYAAARQAEILLSLHNNALSNGENPFVHHGSAVYYYQPQSFDLAWILHEHLLQTTLLPDHGLYYQNLALARPTDMLAVLIESAFLMYPEEETLLRDEAFIQRTARGICDGLKEYLQTCKREAHNYH